MRMLERWALGLLALSAASVAFPALFAPREFFDDYPLGGGWVHTLPPYNEHLTRDVGGLYLGFTVLFAWCAVTLRRALVVPVCVAWSAFAVAHLVFHATHGKDAHGFVLQLISLAVVLVLGAAVAVVGAREP